MSRLVAASRTQTVAARRVCHNRFSDVGLFRQGWVSCVGRSLGQWGMDLHLHLPDVIIDLPPANCRQYTQLHFSCCAHMCLQGAEAQVQEPQGKNRGIACSCRGHSTAVYIASSNHSVVPEAGLLYCMNGSLLL